MQTPTSYNDKGIYGTYSVAISKHTWIPGMLAHVWAVDTRPFGHFSLSGYEFTHTHTERQRTKGQRTKDVRNSLAKYAPPPPRPIKGGSSSGNSGPSARKTPEAGSSSCRSTDYAPPLWCEPPEVQPVTFWLIVKCLNHLATHTHTHTHTCTRTRTRPRTHTQGYTICYITHSSYRNSLCFRCKNIFVRRKHTKIL